MLSPVTVHPLHTELSPGLVLVFYPDTGKTYLLQGEDQSTELDLQQVTLFYEVLRKELLPLRIYPKTYLPQQGDLETLFHGPSDSDVGYCVFECWDGLWRTVLWKASMEEYIAFMGDTYRSVASNQETCREYWRKRAR